MTYQMLRQGRVVGVVSAWDGLVTKAPVAWNWAVGKPVMKLLRWGMERGFTWKAVS